MRIENIGQKINQGYYNRSQNTKPSNFRVSITNLQKADIVTFKAVPKLSATDRMAEVALEILDKNNFRKGQKLFITGDSNFLPFIEILAAEAYKKGSGLITYNILEPEIEALKKKYKILEEFDYKKSQIAELKASGALFLEFSKKNNPYKAAKMSLKEIKNEQIKLAPNIPKSVQNLFKIDPHEVLVDALDVHKGQPVTVNGEREHLPFIIKLVEFLYAKNGTKLVDVAISNDSKLNMLKYGDEKLLTEVPNSLKAAEMEAFEKDIAYLALEGRDPNKLEGIDTKRIVKHRQAINKEMEEIYNKTTGNIPWLVYYAPTTKSCADAYSEFKNPIEALSQAYKDAAKINRMGCLKTHIDSLNYRADKMNEIMDKGYRIFHYISVDDKGIPDGKTDFKVTMSPKSVFNAARMKMEKYGHFPIVNIPTEEVFTAPKADTAEGVISATMPLCLNGRVVEGIRFKFHEGKIVDIKADTNEEMLKEHIAANKNADRLGEVALVAGSPITKTGRLFKSTLLDENASCHLAIGNAYPDTVKGATEIEDYSEMQKYLKDLNINSSPTHNDFMVGGINVNITAINDETGDTIDIIKNDKFLL